MASYLCNDQLNKIVYQAFLKANYAIKFFFIICVFGTASEDAVLSFIYASFSFCIKNLIILITDVINIIKNCLVYLAYFYIYPNM